MVIRRVILIAMLTALACCAGLGVMGVFIQDRRAFEAFLWAAMLATVALGLMLPLTLLVERKGFRAAGLAGMGLIGFAAACGVVLVAAEARWLPRRLEDFAAAVLGLSALYGVPAVGGLLLVKYKWARPAAWTLAGVAAPALAIASFAGFLGYMSGSSYWFMRESEDLLVTSGVLFGMGFLVSLLLVNVACGDRRYFRFPAMALGVVVFFLFMPMIWDRGWLGVRHWYRVPLILLLPVVYFAHLNVLLMARGEGRAGILRTVTSICAGASLAVVAVAILYDDTEEIVALAAATGIAAVCGTLAVAGMALLRRRTSRAEDFADSTMLNEIEIFCPRCRKRQVLALGDSACGECGLKLQLKALEPRCEACGYLLYGITSKRCPECGTELGAAGGAGVVSGGATVARRAAGEVGDG